VQFDFPFDFAQGKPNENGQPYKSSGEEMVWNDAAKQEIREGWAVKKLLDWIKSDKSDDWGTDEPHGNYVQKVSCIRGTDINGINGMDSCNPPVRFILEKNAHKILNSHDLIIEILGGAPKQSTGRLAYITEAVLKRFENLLICSNFCKAITLKDKKYLYNFV
jgi:type I restriction enzyme, S subunit